MRSFWLLNRRFTPLWLGQSVSQLGDAIVEVTLRLWAVSSPLHKAWLSASSLRRARWFERKRSLVRHNRWPSFWGLLWAQLCSCSLGQPLVFCAIPSVLASAQHLSCSSTWLI